MNITGSNSPSTLNQSILKLANQQPELALQLLQKSLEGGTLQTGQAPSQAVSPVTAQTSSRIDIRV
jgi:hypothetical protein